MLISSGYEFILPQSASKLTPTLQARLEAGAQRTL